VCVGGAGTGARARKGTMASPGDCSVLQLCRTWCLSVSVPGGPTFSAWGISVCVCVCVCVCFSTAGE
jgi:hypothetical protein